MKAGDAVDRHGIDHRALGHTGQKGLVRILGQEIGKREIDAETSNRLLEHSCDGSLRYRNARVFFLGGRVDDGGLAVKDELALPIISGPVDKRAVRPVHGGLEGMEDVERVTVRVRMDPDRPGLKRKLLGAQGLAHAHQGRARLLADRRFLLLRGGVRCGRR